MMWDDHLQVEFESHQVKKLFDDLDIKTTKG